MSTAELLIDDWTRHLDELGIWRSPVLRGSRGHVMGFRDPDGVQVRLYADDTEGDASEEVTPG